MGSATHNAKFAASITTSATAPTMSEGIGAVTQAPRPAHAVDDDEADATPATALATSTVERIISLAKRTLSKTGAISASQFHAFSTNTVATISQNGPAENRKRLPQMMKSANI